MVLTGMAPPREIPLSKQLALQGALERMPGPRQDAGRLRVVLMWVAIIGGIALAATAI